MYELGLTDIDFKDLISNKKTIEVRAYSSSKDYNLLNKGDSIIFINETTLERCVKEIVYSKYYRSAEELYIKEGFKNINPNLVSIEEALDKLYNIPTYKDRISEFGVFAIKIK